MEKNNVNFIIKSVADSGYFCGYASVFNNVDAHQDIILPGAFSDTLGGIDRIRQIKLLWQHDSNEPIGGFTDIREDGYGLYVSGQLLLTTQRGYEAYHLLKSRAIQGLSIGFTVDKYSIDSSTGIRRIEKLSLWEISLVTFPANPEAGVVEVKADNFANDNQKIRDFKQQFALLLEVNRVLDHIN